MYATQVSRLVDLVTIYHTMWHGLTPFEISEG
jgi:hypothetical protein